MIRLVLIVVCHLPPRIVIMTSTAVETVPRLIKAPGGTTFASIPIWMVEESPGSTGNTATIWRDPRWRHVRKIFKKYLALCIKWSVCLWDVLKLYVIFAFTILVCREDKDLRITHSKQIKQRGKFKPTSVVSDVLAWCKFVQLRIASRKLQRYFKQSTKLFEKNPLFSIKQPNLSISCKIRWKSW